MRLSDSIQNIVPLKRLLLQNRHTFVATPSNLPVRIEIVKKRPCKIGQLQGKKADRFGVCHIQGDNNDVEMVMLPDTLQPTAVFTDTPRSGIAPHVVAFSNGSNNADSFIWNFGDGHTLETSITTPISHTYSASGAYTVSLTAITGQYNHVVTYTNYSYDDNGNLLDDGEYSYSYDSANRLNTLDDGVSTMSYLYNGDGVRVAQIVNGVHEEA